MHSLPGASTAPEGRRVWETCRASLVVSLGSLTSEVGDQPISEDSGDSSAPQLRPTRGHSDHIRVANSPVRTCGRTPSSRRPWALGPGPALLQARPGQASGCVAARSGPAAEANAQSRGGTLGTPSRRAGAPLHSAVSRLVLP